jgi:hypothetical protein
MKAHHENVVIALTVPTDTTLIELHKPSMLREDRVRSARPIVVVAAQARVICSRFIF